MYLTLSASPAGFVEGTYCLTIALSTFEIVSAPQTLMYRSIEANYDVVERRALNLNCAEKAVSYLITKAAVDKTALLLKVT